MDFPMIDVVAPADLPAGYQFEAAIDNTIFMATVPMGGVKKGQTFSCYMKDIKQAGIPYGHWKDGFFDVFKFGFKHPMVLNSFFCPLLALGQVMARVGLDYTGQQLDADARRQSGWSARGMMACVIFFWLGLNSLIVYGFELKLHHFLYLSAADIFSLVIVNATFIFFTIYSTIKTRAFLQEKFQIDRQSTEAQLRRENVILSTLCLPLTIAQMGRHTASYDRYEGVCCNENGIPKEENNDVSTGAV
jgi:Cys-rich protein (TIGR01571 family)